MKWYGLLKQTIKAVSHKFYLVHSWILCLVLLGKVADKKHSERLKVWYFLGNSVANALIILFENSPDNSLSELPFHKSNLNNPFWPCLCSRSFLNLRFIIWILFEYYLRHIISSINRSENSWKVFENPLKHFRHLD